MPFYLRNINVAICACISGALPFVQAKFPTGDKFFPILYDSPACNSTRYNSIFECPREKNTCNFTRRNFSSLASNQQMATLERLSASTRSRDQIFYVGVKCEGERV